MLALAIKFVAKSLLAMLIVTLPLQIVLLVYEPPWGNGLANNFINIYLNQTEILIIFATLSLLISNFLEKKPVEIKSKYSFIVLIGCLCLALSSLIISPYQNLDWHMLLAIKIVELLPLGILLTSELLTTKTLIRLFQITMLLQAVLAILQVLVGSSLGFTLLGEPFVSITTANVAKIQFLGLDLIRGYGTFAHPNILGGFLTISILSSIIFIKSKSKLEIFLIAILACGLVATFSRSAIIALLIGAILIVLYSKTLTKKKRLSILGIAFIPTILLLFSISQNFLQNESFIERVNGFKTAIGMIISHPFGVGFHSYTLFLDETLGSSLKPWEYQPVHNIFLLIWAELGSQSLLIILALLTILICKIRKNKIAMVLLISIIMLGLFDHYLLTLSQGNYLLVLVFALISLVYEGKTALAKSAEPSKN